MIVESSPVDSQGNGVVERTIKSVQGQIRLLRSALEDWIKAKLEPDHPVLAWMCECTSVLLNHFEVGEDGMTAFERNKRKKTKAPGLEFDEACQVHNGRLRDRH